MNCLLVAATAKEIDPFLDHYRNNDIPAQIDILITGIGLTAATYSITKQIYIKRPDLVIQAGIAGSFDKNIIPGQVLAITQDTIADLSVIENKKLNTMFDLGFVKSNSLPFTKGLLINPNKKLIKLSNLRPAGALSVNHITTSKDMIKAYTEKFHAIAESMEGAALHYVCLLEKIPFLQIRGISNYAGERNKKKWNLKDAITNLNNELIELMYKVHKQNY